MYTRVNPCVKISAVCGPPCSYTANRIPRDERNLGDERNLKRPMTEIAIIQTLKPRPIIFSNNYLPDRITGKGCHIT